MRMYQVDAFTDRLFAGNPAAVLLLDGPLPDALMLAIAAENNLAETAFATPRPDGSWDLRWCTPVTEVDFCGHATLATAHVLATETTAPAPWIFHTRVGELRVTPQDTGYLLDLPCLPPEPLDAAPPEIAGIFPEPPHHFFRSFENVFADLGSAQAVRTFVPDLAAIAQLGAQGLVVTGAGDNHNGRAADFTSRYFAPGAGIPEDPVTGSIHATLTPYWAEKLGKSRMTAHQASPRGGWLGCAMAGARVHITGQAVTFMRAEITLPA